jgi:replication-associated recombination protein RarA
LTNRYFPFEALGFQCNPFRALTEDEWAAIAVIPPEIHELVQSEDTHLQFLGDAGHGKSTLLRGLTTKLRASGKRVHFEYLPLGQRHFKTPSVTIGNIDVFLLDETQRLTRRQRKKLFSIVTQHRVRLMVGTHEDLAQQFTQNRMSLATTILDDINQAILSDMLIKRLDYFRTDQSPHIVFDADAILYLISRFGRNLRQIEYYLYEVFQHLTLKQQVAPISAALLTQIDPYIIIPVGPV